MNNRTLHALFALAAVASGLPAKRVAEEGFEHRGAESVEEAEAIVAWDIASAMMEERDMHQ